jgi:hypothetical protein
MWLLHFHFVLIAFGIALNLQILSFHLGCLTRCFLENKWDKDAHKRRPKKEQQPPKGGGKIFRLVSFLIT